MNKPPLMDRAAWHRRELTSPCVTVAAKAMLLFVLVMMLAKALGLF